MNRRRVVALAVCTALAGGAAAMPGAAEAKSCGVVRGAKIVTNGKVSCKTARKVYRAYKSGRKLPRGWTCAASAGACYKGSRSFTFRFN